MEKKNIIIVGGGGFAYECYLYVLDISKADSSIAFKGFAAPESSTIDAYGLSKFNLGAESSIPYRPDDYYVIGIGTPAIRRKVFGELNSRGKKHYNLIHPTARITDYVIANIGQSNIFVPNSGVSSLKFGDCNVVNAYSGFAHDTEVGSFNVLSAFCDICGHAKMGDMNFFGSHAVMLPSSKIGNNNKIAAGAVVYKGCRDNKIMLGNPAEIIGEV